MIPGGPFLVGSGGANDVASRAAECLVVTLAGPNRLVEEVGFVTSPGERVQTVVTDLGVLRKRDGELCVAAVPTGDAPLDERVRAAVGGCGWDVRVDRDVVELDAPSMDEVVALRRYVPQAWFLR
jgi:acyl CoA:acetate/3-ketoacid CoA transferase beta subunit